MKLYLLPFMMCVLMFAVNVAAQEETPELASDDSCSELLKIIAEQVNTVCDELNPNQACIGSDNVQADTDVETIFENTGDVADIDGIANLVASGFNTETGTGGVVDMMLVSGQTGETVQILVFGDVEVTDVNQFVWVQATEGVNIRETPEIDGTLVTPLANNVRIQANRRLEDSSWVHVIILDEDLAGWVNTNFVQADENLDVLEVVPLDIAMGGEIDERATFAPMRAISVNIGSGNSPCEELTQGGLLIQTPKGAATIDFLIDGVVVTMGADSTGYISENGIFAVEGPIWFDDVPAPPCEDDCGLGPLLNMMSDPVTVWDGKPTEGDWLFTWEQDALTCPVELESSGEPGPIRLQEGGLEWGSKHYNETSRGIYEATYTDGEGNLHQDTLIVVAANLIQGEKTIDFSSMDCTIEVSFTVELVDGD